MRILLPTLPWDLEGEFFSQTRPQQPKLQHSAAKSELFLISTHSGLSNFSPSLYRSLNTLEGNITAFTPSRSSLRKTHHEHTDGMCPVNTTSTLLHISPILTLHFPEILYRYCMALLVIYTHAETSCFSSHLRKDESIEKKE